jgi:hypothetical protein
MSVTDQWWPAHLTEPPEHDRTVTTPADLDADWLERELYEQDSERWEVDEDA